MDTRQFIKRLNEAQVSTSVALRKLTKHVKQLGDPKLILSRLDMLEGRQLSFRQYMTQKSAKAIPFNYRVDVALTTGSTARTTNTTNISQDGWFFLDRIYASWLPSTGGDANRWQPISAGHPEIAAGEAVSGGNIATVLNFFFEWSDGRAERNRQSDPIPSDLLYRTDGDGLLGPEGDQFGPNSTVTFAVTPTLAPTVDGTLYFTLQGVQCLDVLKE
jgi:hypothetical protein